MKIKINGNQGTLITVPEDKFSRADSRLIVLINRIKREVKDPSVESLFHHEIQYDKNENEVMSFDANLKDKVITVINKNGYAIK